MKVFRKWLILFRDSPRHEGFGIARTLLLSALVGAGVGLGAVVLVSLLQLSEWFFLGLLANYKPASPAGEPVVFALPEIFGSVRRWILLFLPMLGGLLSSLIVQRFAPEAEGHGTDAAIEAYHFRGGKVRPVAAPVKAVATSLLIGTGGSAGCEGPITQIGSGIGSTLAGLLKLPVADRRALMAAGMGTGVGALFHAPLAGAIFGAEVLYRDLDLEYEVLVPSIIASVTGYSIFSKVFGFNPLFSTPDIVYSRPEMLILYLVLAVILAGGARFYTWMFYTVRDKFEALELPVVLKPALGGLLTGIIGFMFLPALCSGYGVIQEALHYNHELTGRAAYSALKLMIGVFFLKTLSTSFSVASGGSGGIFGPALVVGGALGAATGIIFSLLLPGWDVPIGSFTLVGMVAFFGCAAKMPISTILMVGEMTGNYRLLVPSMWVCMIAYMLSRKVSLYRMQLPNRFDAPIHRGAMISGVVHNVKVRELLEGKGDGGLLLTVREDTPLGVLVDAIAEGVQGVFPVVSPDGIMLGMVTEKELADVVKSDPILRSTLLVADISLREYAVVTEDDILQKALAYMDAGDMDEIVVVSGDGLRKPIGLLSHNDIAAAYQREIEKER
ncbi:MAG: chloride channel protein [Lentisphaerae bacterium]|jgi:CIC family chloride channel protein|nr:chloride channel protein [Lentisphaerota bacterium]